jgi:hypothetical protein
MAASSSPEATTSATRRPTTTTRTWRSSREIAGCGSPCGQCPGHLRSLCLAIVAIQKSRHRMDLSTDQRRLAEFVFRRAEPADLAGTRLLVGGFARSGLPAHPFGHHDRRPRSAGGCGGDEPWPRNTAAAGAAGAHPPAPSGKDRLACDRKAARSGSRRTSPWLARS